MPLGIVSALKRNTLYDYAGMGIAILGVSVPVIITAPLLQYLFGVEWKPAAPDRLGRRRNQTILPALDARFRRSAAIIARLTRASLLQVLNEDYIRTARAKGLRRAARRHRSRAQEQP